jgi:hypothetical protein
MSTALKQRSINDNSIDSAVSASSEAVGTLKRVDAVYSSTLSLYYVCELQTCASTPNEGDDATDVADPTEEHRVALGQVTSE